MPLSSVYARFFTFGNACQNRTVTSRDQEHSNIEKSMTEFRKSGGKVTRVEQS